MQHDRPGDRESRLRVGGWVPDQPASDEDVPKQPKHAAWPWQTRRRDPDMSVVGTGPAGAWDDRVSDRLRILAIAGAVVMVTAMVIAGMAVTSHGGHAAAVPPPVDATLPVLTDAPQSIPVSVAPKPLPPSTQASSSSQVATTRPATSRPAAGETTKPVTTTVAATTPSLSVAAGAEPSTVDLSAEGSRDWVHWGFTGDSSIDRKAFGTGEIKDLGGSPRGRYDNNPQLFKWGGGSPNSSVGGTPTGVYSCGQGSTFSLRVAAGSTTRTLRVYAGVWMAQGTMTVTLDGLTVTRTLENKSTISTNRFEITFRAPAGSNLTVTWTTTAVFHPTCGNVDLQAATLS